MEKIVVGVADDLKSVHDMFQKFLEPYRNEIEIKDFYFTSQVDDFLRKTPNGLDMLFLDVLFEGSTSGIDALPDFRKKAPDLPITLLTAQHFPSEGIDIRRVCKEYKVDVMKKPVEEVEIITRIDNIKSSYDVFQKLQQDLLDYSSFAEELEYETIQEKAQYAEYIETLNEQITKQKKIPDNVAVLINGVFPNLEFSASVLMEIMSNNLDKEVYKELSSLNNGSELKSKDFGANNLYEYKVSKECKILVKKEANHKPVIFAIKHSEGKQ